MAKEYKIGEKYYLPVTVKSICPGYKYPIDLEFIDSNYGDTEDSIAIADEPDLLLIAEEIATVINTERDDALAELKSRNAELEALLKEVMATRDEAIRQNDELRKENDNLKSDCNDWKDTADDRIVDVQNLTAERDNLKADLTTQKEVNEELKAKIAELTAWYEEANKTATVAADANDDLKKKIADPRNRVGEQLAQIQDLNAEIHFHKEFGEGLDKQQKELQARYDELDSVNKEQAEKIRKLEVGRDTWERNAKAWKMTADGMSKRAEELQAENEKLNNRNKYLESEKNRKPVHVVTNDGTDIAFNRNAEIMYRTDVDMFVVNDGDKTVAGFLRGDKPGNLAYFWTE